MHLPERPPVSQSNPGLSTFLVRLLPPFLLSSTVDALSDWLQTTTAYIKRTNMVVRRSVEFNAHRIAVAAQALVYHQNPPRESENHVPGTFNDRDIETEDVFASLADEWVVNFADWHWDGDAEMVPVEVQVQVLQEGQFTPVWPPEIETEPLEILGGDHNPPKRPISEVDFDDDHVDGRPGKLRKIYLSPLELLVKNRRDLSRRKAMKRRAMRLARYTVRGRGVFPVYADDGPQTWLLPPVIRSWFVPTTFTADSDTPMVFGN